MTNIDRYRRSTLLLYSVQFKQQPQQLRLSTSTQLFGGCLNMGKQIQDQHYIVGTDLKSFQDSEDRTLSFVFLTSPKTTGPILSWWYFLVLFSFP
jgi:hypothetical protein